MWNRRLCPFRDEELLLETEMARTKINDHEMTTRDRHSVLIYDYGMDDDTVAIKFHDCGLSAGIDMTIDELVEFRDLLTEAVNDAFRVRPDTQCPCCGYTWEDAKMHGDHRICRRYPFFPGERGKTEAISK